MPVLSGDETLEASKWDRVESKKYQECCSKMLMAMLSILFIVNLTLIECVLVGRLLKDLQAGLCPIIFPGLPFKFLTL